MPMNEYIAGAVSGVAGVVVGHPFETVKLQMQTRTTGEHKYSKTFEAFTNVAAHGLKNGLYRGMMFPVLSYSLINSIYFGVYGNTLRMLQPNEAVLPTNWQVCLAGCLSGSAQLLVACPMEVVKCTLQSQIQRVSPHHVWFMPAHSEACKPPPHYYRGSFDCFTNIVRLEGVGGLYKGMFAMFLRDTPGYGVYFVCYEMIYHYLLDHFGSDPNDLVVTMVAGGCAGCLSWLPIMPMDVIKSRLQVDHGGRYRGVWDCAVNTVKRGGFRVMYAGTVVTMLRAFPVNAVTFLVYSQLFKKLNMNNTHIPQHLKKSDSSSASKGSDTQEHHKTHRKEHVKHSSGRRTKLKHSRV